MRNKIAFACLKAEDCTARGGRVTDDEMVRFILGYDGDDPATQEMRDVAFAQADAVVGLLRQEGQSIRWCTEHDAQVWDTLAEPEDQVCHYFEGKPVLKYHNDFCEVADALVLLPEEEE